MRSKMSLILIVALFVTSLSMLTVSGPSVTKVAAQATASAPATGPTCADTGLITSLATDAKTVGDDLAQIPSIGAQSLYGIMINIANTRLKYEDMKTPADARCSYLVTEAIILFANVQDYGLVNMGTKLGLDTTADQPVVLDRLTKQVARVNDLIGTPSQDAATPSADTFATASAAAANPTCADTTLLSGLTTDAKTVGDDLTQIPSTGAGGVYSIMINIANTRLKYEDMKTPADAGCNYLITETIILFANVQDYGLISMGNKLGLDTSADQPVVLDRLTKQVARVNDLIAPAK